jgi:CHRD domain
MKKFSLIIAALAAGLLVSAPAYAEVLTFKAVLDGASQSPPVDTKATGTADIKVDTEAKTITWTIKSADLSGPPNAAHFHGPAAVGANADPEIDISKMIDAGTSPITEAQIADLQGGMIYLNIHTEKFPKGEIRGQVVK